MSEAASRADDPHDGWFRTITERAGDTFYRIRVRPDVAVLFISDTVCIHSGYTAEELKANPRLVRSALAPQDLGQLASALQGKPGDDFRADLPWLHKDDSVVWIEHHGTFAEGPDGSVILEGTGYNITEEMRLKSSLEASEARYRLLAENASDVVVLTSPDGIIRWASPSVTRIMGWARSGREGQAPADFLHPDDLAAVDHAVARVTAGETVALSARVRIADGSYRWYRITMTPMLDADGEYTGRISAFHDVDDLVQADRALRDTLKAQLDPNVTLRAVRDESGGIVDLEYVHANAAAVATTSSLAEDLLGRTFLELFPDQRGREPFVLYVRTIETGEPTVLDDYVFADTGDQSPHHFDMRGVRVGDAINLTWRDVTQRGEAARALAASEEQYRLLAENSSDVVVRTRDNQILWVSPSLTRMLGWRPDEWIGHSMNEFGHPDDLDRVVAAREEMLSGSPAISRIRIKDRQGVYHWTEVHSKLYLDAAGRIDGIQSSLRTIDKEVQAEEDLQRRARYDDLTGVYKRDEAILRLGDVTSRRRTPGSESAAMFIDIDSFKAVNDTYGHAAGDAVLETLTVRIRDAVRAGDTIARMGGDEFIVILDGIHGIGEAESVAEKIRVAAARPVATSGGPVCITVSIGVTLTTSLESADEVIARADAAMYRAKNSGRDQVVAL